MKRRGGNSFKKTLEGCKELHLCRIVVQELGESLVSPYPPKMFSRGPNYLL